MRTIVLLMGPHGSGKTSLANAIDRQGPIIRLRQYTTRPRRDGEGDEYSFVAESQADALWRYTKAGAEYGLLSSELANLPDGFVGVVAVHTEVVGHLKQNPSDVRLLTVGLDTLVSHDDQLSRVNNIEGRVQSAEAFEESRRVAKSRDVCLSGEFGAVLRELTRILEQQSELS